jgi:hypothetical protein
MIESENPRIHELAFPCIFHRQDNCFLVPALLTCCSQLLLNSRLDMLGYQLVKTIGNFKLRMNMEIGIKLNTVIQEDL